MGAAAGTGALVAFAGLPAGIALAAGGASVPCSGAGGGGGIASGPGNGGDPTGSSLTLNATTVAHNSATEGGGEPAGAGIANGGLAVIRSSLITDNAAPGKMTLRLVCHGPGR